HGTRPGACATAAAPACESPAGGWHRGEGHPGAAREGGRAGGTAGDTGGRAGDGAAARDAHRQRESLKREGGGDRGSAVEHHGARATAGATATAPAREGDASGGRGSQRDRGAAGERSGA